MSQWSDDYYIRAPDLPARLRCRQCGSPFVFIEDLRGHALSKHHKPGSEWRRWIGGIQGKVESYEHATQMRESNGLTGESVCVAIESSDREIGESHGREKLERGCYRATRL